MYRLILLNCLFFTLTAACIAAEVTEDRYTRRGNTSEGVISSDVRWQELVPPIDSDKPRIWLVATAHYADSAYYQEVQRKLDGVDLVLYEGARQDLDRSALSESRTLQTHVLWARALGLALEEQSLRYDRPHFQNSDFSSSQFAKELGLRSTGSSRPSPLGSTKEKRGTDPSLRWTAVPYHKRDVASKKPDRLSLGHTGRLEVGLPMKRRYSLREVITDDPSYVASLTGKLAAAESSPLWRALFRTYQIEKPDKPDAEMSAEDQLVMDVILDGRNEHVVKDLKKAINTTKPLATIAVYYGAAHMKGIAAELQKELGYRLGEHTWKTLFSVTSPSNDDLESLTPNELYLLGQVRARGKTGPKNMKQAVVWWRKAAEQGYARAQYALGLALLLGQDVPENAEEGRRWVIKAANQGLPGAAGVAGRLYQEGLGVVQNPKLAVDWYRKAAAQGDLEALFDLALLYETGGVLPRDPETPITLWVKAANLGHLKSQGLLGSCYLFGRRGFQKDAALGLKWMDAAAKNGSVDAQGFLGNAYFRGDDGIPQDVRLGMEWLKKAADNGSANACTLLGSYYQLGINGVEQSPKKAHAWFRKGAERGDEVAQFGLALLLAKAPLSGNPDFSQAYAWAKLAADQGHKHAGQLCEALKLEMPKLATESK